MRTALLFVVGFVVGVTLYACSPRQPTAVDANAWVNRMRFARHQNGLCFGVMEFSTYSGYIGTSITHVPDEACR